jgi:hypothetical protein
MNKAGFLVSRRAHSWLGTPPTVGHEESIAVSDEDLIIRAKEIIFTKDYPNGLMIKASRGGLITFNFEGIKGFKSSEEINSNLKKNENLSAALLNARTPIGDALNSFLACLNGSLQQSTGIVELEGVQNNRLYEVDSNLSAIHTVSYPVGNLRYRPHTIGVAQLEAAADALNSLLTHPDSDAIKCISLYNLSVASFGQLDFARSLITAWAVVEKLINVLWKQFISTNSQNNINRFLSPPTSGARADKLKSNNITASIKTEILSITNIITEEEYREIEKSRKARNEWMHTLKNISHEDAISCAFAAALLIKKIYHLKVQTKYQAWGSWAE